MSMPFELDYKARKPLSQQAADGFRTAIKEGVYADGAPLPTLRELARLWGVSLKVPAQAYDRLAREGYVVLHPRRGAVANRSGVRSWNGNILFASVGFQGGFFLPHLLQSMRMEIEAANLRFYTAIVPVGANGKGVDLSRFSSYLTHPYDMVIVLTDNLPLRRMVRKTASASLIIGQANRGNPDADIALSTLAAEREFLSDCCKAGVRTVTVMVNGMAKLTLPGLLRSAGINVRVVRLERPRGLEIGEGLQKAAYDYCITRRSDLTSPDLIYFADDNISLGALIAFADLGISVPRDVRIVSLSNCGSRLPFGFELTRIECDPVRMGRDAVQCALRRMHGSSDGAKFVSDSLYIRGDTFPL